MFVDGLHCIFWRMVQYLSQSIIYSVQRLIVILDRGSILWRCQSPYHQQRWQVCRSLWWILVHPRVSPYLCSTFHHITTLEKTTCRQCSILINLLRWRPSGLPVLGCCSFSELSGTFWLSDLVFPGLSDAVEASTFGSLTLYRVTKSIIGFDFAVTISSLALSAIRCAAS